MRTIYLDFCTTTPVAASVRESMLPFLNEFYGHPHSMHWYGRAAQEAIEDARCNVASLIGCHPSEVIFCSGGTESVNIALLGVASAIQASCTNAKPHLVTSHLDHACVRYCSKQLEKQGWEITFVGCDDSGVIDLNLLRSAIKPSTRIVSVIMGSHRIGTVQPIQEIAQLCQEADVLFHTDAAQTVGKIPCNVEHLGVDLLSLSGHKFYGPKGSGALFVRTGVPIDPILFGEGGEAALRPGTANVPAIVGLGQAAKLMEAGLKTTVEQTTRMRDSFLNQLQTAVGSNLKVHGANQERLPHILSFELPGVSADSIQRMLPEICLGDSGKSSQDKNGKITNSSHAALGLSEAESASTIRVSFGWTTSSEHIEIAAQQIASAYESLRC